MTHRKGFTLAELMIVILIMAILAGLGFSAFNGVMNMAREQRTGTEIKKISALIGERWEGYRTRSVPVKSLAANPLAFIYADTVISAAQAQSLGISTVQQSGRSRGLLRVLALRALMRMELPDRRTDVVNFTNYTPEVQGFAALSGGNVDLSQWMAIASLQRKYFNTAVKFLGGQQGVQSTYNVLNNWTPENEGAECLYLILGTMRDGDKAALDYFDSTEIGDTDNDGMPEILDGWGNPIKFIRWPAGYVQPALPPGYSQQDTATPDPFDPAKSDPQWLSTPMPYSLYPLIYSAGRDKSYDIAERVDANSTYRFAVPTSPSLINLPNDPYFNPNVTGQYLLGTPADIDGDGRLSFADNITNQSNKE
jgi:prepilin-type N-terminal cleavage/methylation domain-containing protein